MIVGSYSLDLYCNTPECYQSLTVHGPIYQTRGACAGYARSQGWVVGNAKAWCPDHAKGHR